MDELANKHILLGVTGGIAAYKSVELVRLLRNMPAEVRVVMTRAAAAFVTPLTFQAVSDNPVRLGVLDADDESAMGHIALARWADLVLIAPATADFISKLRAGSADDLLSTLCLATQAGVVLVPAMNRIMWHHPATQDNVKCLAARGVHILGPADGAQACGETGPGRMLEPDEICRRLESIVARPLLQGRKVLVTAGPTREAIDSVRYISNRSSGRMGFAVAAAARAAGAEVTLVHGPVALTPPGVQEVVAVESAEEMYHAVVSRAASQHIYIGAAAVADYRAMQIHPGKIKKCTGQTILTLEKTPDILAVVAQLPDGPFTVGFAAETENLEDHAREKLKAKSLDMIAANWVGRPGGGFESEQNALHVFWHGGEKYLPRAPKPVLAKRLIELIAERYEAQGTD